MPQAGSTETGTEARPYAQGVSGGIVIVGGGLASARVVENYREAGGDEPIVLVSADTRPPYHRPPLSKRLLRGEQEADDALVEPRDFYAEHDVDLRLETWVERLYASGRRLELRDGEALPFDRLVIASVAFPRKLPVPGADLEGVHVLRTVDDSLAIRDRARDAERAVVVGTGFIGLETTASLRAIGLDVTLVDAGDALFAALEAPPFSQHLEEVYRGHGVEVLHGERVDAFTGNGTLTGARLASGREVEAQLAIVGIGVEPSTAWLDGSGVEVDDGVVVDERFRTGHDGVFAAGDVARFFDPVFGRGRRIEHWSNASYHGTQLGKALAGKDARYDVVSSFFTELFGRSFKVFGDSEGHDDLQVEGDFASAVVVSYLREGRLVAALVTGQDEEAEAALKERIRADARG